MTNETGLEFTIPEDEPDGVAFNPIKPFVTKPRVELVSPEFIMGLGEVLGDSALKKGDRNWEINPSDWLCHYGSLQRHLNLWRMGHTYDSDSGKNHLLHAACRIMMLYVLQQRNHGSDDRVVFPKMKEKN